MPKALVFPLTALILYFIFLVRLTSIPGASLILQALLQFVFFPRLLQGHAMLADAFTQAFTVL